MNELQALWACLNKNNWQVIQRWLRRRADLPIERLLEGHLLDRFGVPVPPAWLTGRHRYAVLLYLLSRSTYREHISVLDLKGLFMPCLPDCLAAFPKPTNSRCGYSYQMMKAQRVFWRLF